MGLFTEKTYTSIPSVTRPSPHGPTVGLVFSGGGSRTAYQVGALRAIYPYLENSEQKISVISGSSVGSLNGLVTAACLRDGLEAAVVELERLWLGRTYRSTFSGSPSMAFVRAIKVAILRYSSPGPAATSAHIFDPTPLIRRVDEVLEAHGGTAPDTRHPELRYLAVMTTREGIERKPLLFVSSEESVPPSALTGASFEVCPIKVLTAKHGLASAALPSVLPPVVLDLEDGRVTLVDGGISANIPVDPTVRLGAQRVVVLDASGREWWFNHYKHPHDLRPVWEVPAKTETFCLRPLDTLVIRNQVPFGPLLRQSVARSTTDFIEALGATWPIFTLLKRKMGEELAYEVMSYVALHPDYIRALLEQGFKDATAAIEKKANGRVVIPDADRHREPETAEE